MSTKDVQQSDSLQEQVLEIGTRLKNAPSDVMIKSAFSSELSHQVHLFEAIGLVDIAHTLIAIELGTIPKSQGNFLLAQLVALQSKPDSFELSPARGDIYTNREAWLAERTDAVGWLGVGPCPKGSDDDRIYSGTAANTGGVHRNPNRSIDYPSE